MLTSVETGSGNTTVSGPGNLWVRGPSSGLGRGGFHRVGPASVQDFLTDGSIARLCDEMSRLTSVPIWLQDSDGRAVVPITPGPGQPAWQMLSGEAGAERAFRLVGKSIPNRLELFRAPLKTSEGDVGAIVMPVDWGSDDPVERRSLERAVLILANTAAESCQGQLEVRRKLSELDALFRLSSILVQADHESRVLEAALELALDVLEVDAGTIAVLTDEGELEHRVARGLSQQWLTEQTPISADGLLRAKALLGEVVWVEDLQTDPRITATQRVRDENLCSLLMTGLVYHNRAAGLIRLYSRKRRTFKEEECDLLRALADQAAMAMAHSRLRGLREQDQQMQRQVRLAADVQRRMLPRSLPKLDALEIAARYEPSFQLGGDFYDVEMRDGKLGFVVADVVGKGVPAALIMSSVRSTLRAYSSSVSSLAELLSKVNVAMQRDTLESEFVTLLIGLIDPGTLEFICASAGHDPALLFRRTDSAPGAYPEVLECGVSGMVAGIDPAQVYEETRYQLQPGDVLLAFTDGLSDAVDFESRKFGRARVQETVCKLLAAEPGASATRVIEHLMWTLRQFSGVRMGIDDITIVAIKVNGRRVAS